MKKEIWILVAIIVVVVLIILVFQDGRVYFGPRGSESETSSFKSSNFDSESENSPWPFDPDTVGFNECYDLGGEGELVGSDCEDCCDFAWLNCLEDCAIIGDSIPGFSQEECEADCHNFIDQCKEDQCMEVATPDSGQCEAYATMELISNLACCIYGDCMEQLGFETLEECFAWALEEHTNYIVNYCIVP